MRVRVGALCEVRADAPRGRTSPRQVAATSISTSPGTSPTLVRVRVRVRARARVRVRVRVRVS